MDTELLFCLREMMPLLSWSLFEAQKLKSGQYRQSWFLLQTQSSPQHHTVGKGNTAPFHRQPTACDCSPAFLSLVCIFLLPREELLPWLFKKQQKKITFLQNRLIQNTLLTNVCLPTTASVTCTTWIGRPIPETHPNIQGHTDYPFPLHWHITPCVRAAKPSCTTSYHLSTSQIQICCKTM